MSRLVKIVNNKYVQIEEYKNPNICFNTNEYNDFEDYCTLRKTFDPFEIFYENQELKSDYGTKAQIERDMLQQENKILKENAENNDRVVDKVNWKNQLLKKENKKLKDLIDTILNFSFFKEECPLNFGFENNTNEDKAQDVFYKDDDYCENNCNDDYTKCWLKYFKRMHELEGSDK